MQMKKKYTYIRPQAVVMDIEPVSLCASSSSFNIDTQSQGDEDEDFSKGHRGTWGNLWAENM